MTTMFASTHRSGRLSGELCEVDHAYFDAEDGAEFGTWEAVLMPVCRHGETDGQPWYGSEDGHRVAVLQGEHAADLHDGRYSKLSCGDCKRGI